MIKKFIKRWPVTFYNLIISSIISLIVVVFLPFDTLILSAYIISMILALLFDIQGRKDEKMFEENIKALDKMLDGYEGVIKVDPSDPENKIKE